MAELVRAGSTERVRKGSPGRSTTGDRIGQAKSIIMERYGVDDMRAFDMLKQLSQDSNTRLTDVAQRVIDTRNTPDARRAD